VYVGYAVSETLHELKCESRFFVELLDGSKTFEVRNNDRCFQKGDRVRLREMVYGEWSVEGASPGVTSFRHDYTGREYEASIGFVYPIDESRVVFSLVRDRMDQ
jgi:hypothetical protein